MERDDKFGDMMIDKQATMQEMEERKSKREREKE